MDNQLVNPNESSSSWSVTISVIALIIILIAVFFAIRYLVFSPSATSTNTENQNQEVATSEPAATSTNSVNAVSETANVMADGRGEIVFVASTKENTTLTEIDLYNPAKDAWILAFSGYRSISDVPTEVFRANFAAITFNKVRVKTLNNSFDLDKTVTVKDGQSTTVNLSF